MVLKAIETAYQGCRFRSRLGVLMDSVNPVQELNFGHTSLSAVACPTGGADVTVFVPDLIVDPIYIVGDEDTIGTPNTLEGSSRHGAAVMAWTEHDLAELFVGKREGMAALTGTFAIDGEELPKCGLAGDEAIVPSLSAPRSTRLTLEASAASCGSVFEVGPGHDNLGATVAVTPPGAIPRPVFEFFTGVLKHGEASKPLASVLDVRLAHNTAPLCDTRIVSHYGQYQAARSARFEHGERGR